MKTTKKILALLLMLGLVSACGIKGSLDLPEDENEQNISHPSNSY